MENIYERNYNKTLTIIGSNVYEITMVSFYIVNYSRKHVNV
jgi:hypothetical protein